MQILHTIHLAEIESEVSTPEKNSHTNEFGKGVKIALINPSFTSAPL